MKLLCHPLVVLIFAVIVGHVNQERLSYREAAAAFAVGKISLQLRKHLILSQSLNNQKRQLCSNPNIYESFIRMGLKKYVKKQ